MEEDISVVEIYLRFQRDLIHVRHPHSRVSSGDNIQADRGGRSLECFRYRGVATYVVKSVSLMERILLPAGNSLCTHSPEDRKG